MLLLLATSCLDGKADSDPCPYDLVSFCLREFGGPCPTFDEAAAMTCDGYHFDPGGAGADTPNFGDGTKDCPLAAVGCSGDAGTNLRTSLYFSGTGDGLLESAEIWWDDECVIVAILGEVPEC